MACPAEAGATVIESDHLDTLEYDLDHDDPKLDELMAYAELSWYDGLYYGLEATAETFFEIYRDAKADEDEHVRPLKRAYNALKTAQTIADFEDDATDEAAFADLEVKERALVAELLEFYGDRQAFVILEVRDTVYEASAWFLLYRDMLDELGIRVRRAEA